MQVQKYQFYKDLIYLPFIKEIWLFGSRARGDNQARADIDLAVECPQASYKDWLTVLDMIEQSDTLLQIDCIRLDELTETSPLKKVIKHEGIKIYDRR
ncbi:MAG: hypothetical protein BGO68_03980 [Candidatus Amoebophilus sp. 36-38]|nr:MAG: hypothetical protein BGO68_03980 [Candidatus Amoebophilus sp. 36-38]